MRLRNTPFAERQGGFSLLTRVRSDVESAIEALKHERMADGRVKPFPGPQESELWALGRRGLPGCTVASPIRSQVGDEVARERCDTVRQVPKATSRTP